MSPPFSSSLPSRLAWAPLLVSLVLHVQVAVAGEPLVIVVGPPGHPLVARVNAELELMGYATRGMERSAEWLEAARSEGAVGVVELDPARGEIVMWTLGTTQPAALDSRRHVASPDPQVLALQAVELLHAELDPVAREPAQSSAPGPEAAPRDARPSAATPAPEPRAAAARPAPIVIGAGPAITWSRGGLPPLYGLHLAAAWRATSWLEVGALGLVPIASADLPIDKGSTSVRAFAAGLDARLVWRSSRGKAGRAALDLGGAVLIDRTAYSTAADDPFVGTADHRLALRPTASVGVAWLPSPRLGVRAALLVGGAPELPVLGVDSPSAQQEPEPVARYGGPLTTLTLGVVAELGRVTPSGS